MKHLPQRTLVGIGLAFLSFGLISSRSEPPSLEERLREISHKSNPVSVRELISACGSPNSYLRIDKDKLMLAYFNDRSGTHDWVAYVDIEKGFVTEVGFNNAEVNDHSSFQQWPFTDKDILDP